ncbi:MAG: ATP-binding protein [Candidatus Competibacteraceae bacterium]|nr:MAG: ATP-binding protein [Candidatus Competibacteraceae bacterium]
MLYLNLQQLRLRDYRCFEAIDIDFHSKLTILVAANGGGKTAILDAIAVAFGPYIGAFDEAVGKHFESSDIRQFRVRETATNEMEYAAQGVRLEASGCIPDSNTSSTIWRRSLTSPTKAKTTIRDSKKLIDYGKRLQAAVRTPGKDVLLPLIAYYGTGRLWQQKKRTEAKGIQHTSRTIGYADCVDPASSYKSFVEWFRYWNLNAKDLQFKNQTLSPAYQEFIDYIASVTGAVDTCLAPVGWKDIEYSFRLDHLVAHHDQYGELPVALLSDGIRNMIGMVADIAFRATKLNGQLGAKAATQTPGIVLIDEIDMHLHPQWQQIVLQSLTQAFPQMQFIVTTHSPQVLSSVRRENIRVIGPDPSGRIVAQPPLAMTYGEPSGDVMHSVMLVDPQPPVSEKADLQRLTAWVDQGNYASAEATQLMQSLITALGGQHPQLQRLRRSIQRQEALNIQRQESLKR